MMRSLRWVGMLSAVALVAAACTGSDSADTTSTAPVATTTTFAPIEIATVSTTVAAGVDPGVHAQLSERIRDLSVVVQQLRGLAFIQVPDVAIVAFDDFSARYEAALGDALSAETLDLEEATYRLLGQYDGAGSLKNDIRALYDPADAVAFYDGRAAQLLVDGTRAELTPLEESFVVRALAWVLIDQYHDAFDRLVELDDSGNWDAADAFRALAEGDTIAVQLRYLQSLSEDDQAAAAAAAADAAPPAVERLPDVVRDQLAMPAEAGVEFVNTVVAGGGYAALDRAYDRPPATTEQILHPSRFAIRETVREVPALAVELDGYERVAGGSFGEWRLRLLLGDAIAPGLLTQTTSGWGGDAYELLTAGDDLAFVYIYGGDTEDDAIEVAQALLALARGPMGAGDGVDSGGGVLWNEGGPYVFVDRIGDGLMFVAATSAGAGNQALGQIRVP